MLHKDSLINQYINNLYKEQTENTKKTKKKNVLDVIFIPTSLDKSIVPHLCSHHFLSVYTHPQTENYKHYASVPVSIKLGKKMYLYYINKSKDKYIEETKQYISYTSWFNKWNDENKGFALHLDDNLYTTMGCKIIDILIHSELIGLVLKDSS